MESLKTKPKWIPVVMVLGLLVSTPALAHTLIHELKSSHLHRHDQQDQHIHAHSHEHECSHETHGEESEEQNKHDLPSNAPLALRSASTNMQSKHLQTVHLDCPLYLSHISIRSNDHFTRYVGLDPPGHWIVRNHFLFPPHTAPPVSA